MNRELNFTAQSNCRAIIGKFNYKILGFSNPSIKFLPMITASTTIRVRYAETDKMGIAHHGNFFTWLEIGRIHLLEELGIPYRTIEEKGYQMPVIKAHANYISPARFDEDITIKSTIKENTPVRIRIDYELSRDDTRICTGYTVHTFINERGAPTRPPREFSRLMTAAFNHSTNTSTDHD